MSSNQRIAVLVAAAVVLVVGFVIASSSGDDDGGSDSASGTTATATQPSTGADDSATTTTTTTSKPQAPAVPTIVIRDGKPVGGIEKLEFKHNDQIAFNVRSDVADEVHFHGYDVSAEVAPGKVAKLRVKATIEGRFEVELEQRGEEIAQVEVQP